MSAPINVIYILQHSHIIIITLPLFQLSRQHITKQGRAGFEYLGEYSPTQLHLSFRCGTLPFKGEDCLALFIHWDTKESIF